MKYSITHAILASVHAHSTFRAFELSLHTNMFRPVWVPVPPEFAKIMGSPPPRVVKCYCEVTRLEMLDRLFARDAMDRIIARLPHLDTFNLTLFDKEEKESWWMDEIRARTPRLLRNLRLSLISNPFEGEATLNKDSTFGERKWIPAVAERVAQCLAEFCGWREDIPP